MPKPKLSPSSKKPRKIVEPPKKPPIKKFVAREPDIRLLDPVEEDLGLHEILIDKAYASILADIRADLNPTQRLLSKIIHAKGMDSFNDMLVKTIARPAALFGASLLTLAGVFITVFFSKTLGFSYNYLTFVFFFIAGYLLELLVEIVVNLLVRLF